VDSAVNISLFINSLLFFEFCELGLPLPLYSEHLSLLLGQVLLLIFLSLSEIFLNSENGISLINFILVLLSLYPLSFLFFFYISFVELCKQHFL
jgi:hypothetical protein